MTTTAGAASLVTTPTTAQVASAEAGTTAATVTSVAGASASTPEEQAALEAASAELVRAEYLASEGTSSLTPEQLAQITATRDQLRQLLSAATPADAADEGADEAGSGQTTVSADAATRTTLDTGVSLHSAPTLDASGEDAALDGRDTFRASRAGTEGRESLSADPATPEDAPADAAATAVDAPADPAAEVPAAEAPAPAATAETPAAAPAGQAQVAPTIAEIGATTEALRALLDTTAVTVSVEPGPPTAEEVAAQQAAERAAMAAQLAVWANSTAGYSNGTIPESVLCSPSFAPGQLVRCDAAYQLEQLNVAYRAAFGTDISVTSSYRSYGSQVAVKASKGFLAAAPGTSNHGMAQALDLGGGISSFGSAQYAWMRANAPAYGWDNPEWARQGGSKPEAWHWEYGTTY
ncbi:hypothetical protein GCM10010488_25820 [Oerskovia jenensis]